MGPARARLQRRKKRLRSARNFFLVNLILTDILLCLTAIPITPWYAMTKDWTFGPVMCRLVPLCNSCAVFVTSWSLTAIAVDKHMHIVVEPTRRHLSRRIAALITASIWLMSILVNIPYLLSFELLDGFYVISEEQFTRFCGKFCDEFNWSSDVQRRFYGVFVLLFQFIIPMAVITFCHVCILLKVQKDMIVQNVQFRKTLTNSQRMDAINRKKRVNFTLLGMVVAFIGCNVPLIAVNLAKDFAKEPEFLLKQPYLCPLIAHFIAMSIVGWNPMLFFWFSAKDKASHNGSTRTGGYAASQCGSEQPHHHHLHSGASNNNNNSQLMKMPVSAAASLIFNRRLSRSDFWLQLSCQQEGGHCRRHRNGVAKASNHCCCTSPTAAGREERTPTMLSAPPVSCRSPKQMHWWNGNASFNGKQRETSNDTGTRRARTPSPTSGMPPHHKHNNALLLRPPLQPPSAVVLVNNNVVATHYHSFTDNNNNNDGDDDMAMMVMMNDGGGGNANSGNNNNKNQKQQQEEEERNALLCIGNNGHQHHHQHLTVIKCNSIRSNVF